MLTSRPKQSHPRVQKNCAHSKLMIKKQNWKKFPSKFSSRHIANSLNNRARQRKPISPKHLRLKMWEWQKVQYLWKVWCFFFQAFIWTCRMHPWKTFQKTVCHKTINFTLKVQKWWSKNKVFKMVLLHKHTLDIKNAILTTFSKSCRP